MTHSHHEPRHALTPDESEDRPERRNECKLSLCRVLPISKRRSLVFRLDTQTGEYHEVEPPTRWTDGDFYDQPIDAAAGPAFARESACLGRHRIWLVGQFAALVEADDPILGLLSSLSDDEPSAKTRGRKRVMFVQRKRLQKLCLRLEEARLEFNEWRNGR